MKAVNLLKIFLCVSLLTGCDKDNDPTPSGKFEIEGITLENFPVIDGSTSISPLQSLIFCKLLNFKYTSNPIRPILPAWDTWDFNLYYQKVINTGTHTSIINLIDKDADLILVARKMSEDEKQYAKDAGVELIEIPLALDAFIFIANIDNPVKGLTTSQIQDIYQGNIVNWSEVDGNNEEIKPYTRNTNSGSQELMETLVMKGKKIKEWPELQFGAMMEIFQELIYQPNGLGYTVYYYKESIVREDRVKSLAVDGIYPDKNTIANRTYPYTSEVYVSIRSDLDKSSMAYKLYELLQTEAGRKVIEESGYCAYK